MQYAEAIILFLGEMYHRRHHGPIDRSSLETDDDGFAAHGAPEIQVANDGQIGQGGGSHGNVVQVEETRRLLGRVLDRTLLLSRIP